MSRRKNLDYNNENFYENFKNSFNFTDLLDQGKFNLLT